MTDHIQEIDKIIQKAALDGVLTSGAVKQFNELILERDALAKTTEAQKKELEKGATVLQLVQQERDAARSDRDALTQFMDDVKEREKKITELEFEAKYSELRRKDGVHLFETVFKNSVLRREVMTPLAAGEPNQYNSCPSGGFAQKDQVTETEE